MEDTTFFVVRHEHLCGVKLKSVETPTLTFHTIFHTNLNQKKKEKKIANSNQIGVKNSDLRQNLLIIQYIHRWFWLAVK